MHGYKLIFVDKDAITGYEMYIGAIRDTSLIFVLSLFVAYFVGNDFTSRTINNEVQIGYNRLTVILSRGLVILPYAAVLYLFYVVPLTVMIGIFNGFGALSTQTALLGFVAQSLIHVYNNPFTDELNALLASHTYFSELSDEEQALLCNALGLPLYAMRECESAGYKISESTLLAQNMGATGFSVAQLRTIYARFDDELSATAELRAFSAFLRDEALSGDEADAVRALLLAGYSLQNICFAFPVAAALGLNIADVVISNVADITAIYDEYPSLSQETRDILLEQAQMLFVRAEALFAYAEDYGVSGDEVARTIALYIYERQNRAENQLFSDDGSGGSNYPSAPFTYSADASESIIIIKECAFT
jgi:hypothetical protein